MMIGPENITSQKKVVLWVNLPQARGKLNHMGVREGVN